MSLMVVFIAALLMCATSVVSDTYGEIGEALLIFENVAPGEYTQLDFYLDYYESGFKIVGPATSPSQRSKLIVVGQHSNLVLNSGFSWFQVEGLSDWPWLYGVTIDAHGPYRVQTYNNTGCTGAATALLPESGDAYATPPNTSTVAFPEGTLCFRVISAGSDGVWLSVNSIAINNSYWNDFIAFPWNYDALTINYAPPVTGGYHCPSPIVAHLYDTLDYNDNFNYNYYTWYDQVAATTSNNQLQVLQHRCDGAPPIPTGTYTQWFKVTYFGKQTLYVEVGTCLWNAYDSYDGYQEYVTNLPTSVSAKVSIYKTGNSHPHSETPGPCPSPECLTSGTSEYSSVEYSTCADLPTDDRFHANGSVPFVNNYATFYLGPDTHTEVLVAIQTFDANTWPWTPAMGKYPFWIYTEVE